MGVCPYSREKNCRQQAPSSRSTLTGVPLSGRLGTPNPGTRLLHLLTLFLLTFLTHFLAYLHTYSHPHFHPFPLTPTAFIQLYVPLPTLHFLPYPLHRLPFPTLPAAAAMLRSAPRFLGRHGFEQEHAPSGAPRGSSAESSVEAQLIHSYAASCRNYYVL